MNRLEIRDAVGQELSKNTSSMDALTSARLLGYINRRYRALQSAPGLQHLRQAVISFDSEAERAFYGIPNVAAVQRIWDVANARTLYGLSLSDYRQVDPRALEETGTPEAWVWAGYGQVAKQPIGFAQNPWVDSTSGSDTQTATVEARLSSGLVRQQTVTLTGLTAVEFTDLTGPVDISKFYLSSNAAGTVTLQNASLATEVFATIGPGTKMTRHYGLYLWRTPGEALTYAADVTREILDLAADTDEPWLPLDFHDLLVLGAVADEYRHNDDSREGRAEQLYRQRLNDLKYYLAESPTPNLNVEANPIGFSRLGGWFPVDS